ncbi:hypothetical protein, partial [Salmonella sp. M127]|uniref:hypothetical protein n=1 Tax=Salmonella sp. M127 TaxID=3240286 RepID=UPI00352BA505
VAQYLLQQRAIQQYLVHFKSEIEYRLQTIHDGLIALKNKGYEVDAVAPQAAIYLAIKLDLVGKRYANEQVLSTQADVTSYILG